MKTHRGFIGVAALIALALLAAGGVIQQRHNQTEIQSLREQIEEEVNTLGAFNPVGGLTYTLAGSGIGATDTTITLNSFKTPVSSYPLVMSDFGSVGYMTLEPGNSSRQEFISFTGITQNVDGTAALTGVTRGLSPVEPYTASSTVRRAHAGGTQASLSNSPAFYDQFPAKSNTESITGLYTFASTSRPTLDAVATTTNATDFVTYHQLTNTAFSGAGVIDASLTAKGVVELATAAEQAASTANGTLGPLVLKSEFATSTYNSATAGNKVVVTGVSGKIDDNFVATSTLFQNIELATTTAIGDFPAWQIGKNQMLLTTLGTSTFSVPSGITKIYVELVGAGSAGGGETDSDSNLRGGSGGNAGGYSAEMVDVTGTSTIQYYIATENDSTWTSFGTNCFYLCALSANAGGTASGGTINVRGGQGEQGPYTTGGAGASSPFGGGGLGTGSNDTNGGAGQGYGAGGGGGGNSSTPTGSGGTGTQGAILITW